MDLALWTAVDRYFDSALSAADDVLAGALRRSAAAGLPPYHVAPNQGKLLALLAQLVGAKRILEVGTLGAYSTIWMARALAPGGKIVTLESEAKHAAVARANLEAARLEDRVEIRLGPALETLPLLARAGAGPFDLAFIDADKQSNADYFRWALELARPGALIVVDNVVRGGAVTDRSSKDPSVEGVWRLVDTVAAEPRVTATALQTVGSKGYDGLLIARVR
jgi:predicted O-methyltransferase YrrM